MCNLLLSDNVYLPRTPHTLVSTTLQMVRVELNTRGKPRVSMETYAFHEGHGGYDRISFSP